MCVRERPNSVRLQAPPFSKRSLSQAVSMSPERINVYSRNASFKGGVGSFVAQGLAAGGPASPAMVAAGSVQQRLTSRLRRAVGTSSRGSFRHESWEDNQAAPGVPIAKRAYGSCQKPPSFNPYVRCRPALALDTRSWQLIELLNEW